MCWCGHKNGKFVVINDSIVGLLRFGGWTENGGCNHTAHMLHNFKRKTSKPSLQKLSSIESLIVAEYEAFEYNEDGELAIYIRTIIIILNIIIFCDYQWFNWWFFLDLWSQPKDWLYSCSVSASASVKPKTWSNCPAIDRRGPCSHFRG